MESLLTYRERMLSTDEAWLLRRYRKFLHARHLKEKLFCTHCAERGDPEGVRAAVTDGTITVTCRCTQRTYHGQSY